MLLSAQEQYGLPKLCGPSNKKFQFLQERSEIGKIDCSSAEFSFSEQILQGFAFKQQFHIHLTFSSTWHHTKSTATSMTQLARVASLAKCLRVLTAEFTWPHGKQSMSSAASCCHARLPTLRLVFEKHRDATV